MWRSAALSACLVLTAGVAAAQSIGPSTGTEPYLLPGPALAPGSVTTTSILTVGDAVGGYRMVGIPDGLGAYEGRGGTMEVLMNHELPATSGVARSHGSAGAFVSRWTIDRETLEVRAGRDQTRSASDVRLWDVPSGQYVTATTAFNRFCSGDLAAPGAFHYRGHGTRDRLYLNGEENTTGRAFAHVASGPHDGESWQLPRIGRFAYENVVASPHPQMKTVVMGLDDSSVSTAPAGTPSELYVYIGTKTTTGHPVERAGLTNGELWGVQVQLDGAPVGAESNAFGLGAGPAQVRRARFVLVALGDVSGKDAAALQTESIARGITRFQRIEDGAFDPRHRRRNDFYFLSTAAFDLNSRLFRLRFDDIEKPELGGSIDILLWGDEGHHMLDNMTVDGRGRVLAQEDVGNTAHLGKIWLYSTATGDFFPVAEHNRKFFDPATAPSPDFLTQDEESSGVIDASRLLGKGWYLVDVQAHLRSADPELVEPGQLLALYVDPDLGMPARGGRNDEDDDDDEDDQGEDDD